MRLTKLVIISFWVLCCSLAFAADPPPVAMLKSASSQMIVELNKHLGHLKGNDRLINGLVNRILVPHFQLNEMSRSVVGRQYWDSSSTQLQQQFINEFTLYVIRTYSASLESYDGEVIKFFPIRGFNGTQTRVQVDSNIMHRSGPPIQMQYRVANYGGEWRIYDFSVDGVSVIQNYRSQFTGVLRQKGLAALVQELHAKNAGV
jgi:phospholipid transport system substrate-binding protein